MLISNSMAKKVGHIINDLELDLEAAIELLEDGETLAKMGVTDEDHEEVENLHGYLVNKLRFS